MLLEDYIKAEYAEGKIDFTFRAHVYDGVVTIYIHPMGQAGRTTPSVRVHGNTVVLPSDDETDIEEARRLMRLDS
jgi:hypothetical protein